MPETAVPTPGSAQQEKPQTARSGQNPTPASAEAFKDAEVPKGTETPKDKGAGPGEGKTWKRLENVGKAAAVVSVLVLTLALSIYERLKPSGNGPGQKPDAPLHDPHAKLHGTNAPADDKERGLRLVNYRKEAEEALILASFYEREGATDKLRKCLEALRRWRRETIAMHGEPRFRDVDGLVITRTPGETMEKDFWERVTEAIRRLSQQLDEPAVSGIGIAPANKEK